LKPSKPILELLSWRKNRYTTRGNQMTVISQYHIIGIPTNLIKVISPEVFPHTRNPRENQRSQQKLRGKKLIMPYYPKMGKCRRDFI